MIPGMQDMARKLTLARVLGRLARLFPEEYKFSPRTWSLPLELDAFKHYCARAQRNVHREAIGQVQGAGIYLSLARTAAEDQGFSGGPGVCAHTSLLDGSNSI